MAKFTEEDDALIAELGVEVTVKKKSLLTAREERIIAGFEEIQNFVEENKRPPSFDEDKDVFERIYATRLEQIRRQKDCVELLKGRDHQDLLNEKLTADISTNDELDDDALLSELGLSADQSTSDIKEYLDELVPNPENPTGKKITLRKLFEKTGVNLYGTIGHDDALGGVKKRPFNNFRILNNVENLALYNAYNNIDNKDLRKRVVNEIYGDLLKAPDYKTAWINKNTKLATDIIQGRTTLGQTPYRLGAQKVIEKAGSEFPEWGTKKQTEALRIAGIDLSKPEGRAALKSLGVKVENILKKKRVPAGERGFITTALLEDFGKMGFKGLKLLNWLQLEYDVAFESLIYDYHRRYAGHEPELAREALFLPKILAKYFPDLSKLPFVGGLFEPYEAGILEGPAEVLEKRLYEIKRQKKFTYFIV